MSWLTDGLDDLRQHGLSPTSFLSQDRGDAIYKAAVFAAKHGTGRRGLRSKCQTVVLLLAGLALAPSNAGAQQIREVVLAMQSQFSADADEQRWLDSVFRHVGDSLTLFHMPGFVAALTTSANDRSRYVFVILLPEQQLNGEELVFAVQRADTGAVVSEGYRTGVKWGPRAGLTLDKVADFDGDGAADVAFCLWEAIGGGQSLILGFHGHTLYEILTVDASRPKCER